MAETTMTRRESLKKNVGVAKAAADAAIAVVRDALAKKDLVAYGKAMSALKERVGEWNDLICKAKYAEFMEADNPMIAAVREFYVESVRIKETVGDDNVVNGVIFEKKKARIDLEKFCKWGGLSTDWASDSTTLLQLLTLRETDVYNIKPAELAKKSYYFIGLVKAKKDGETPDSNSQIVRQLQKIIDEAIFIDNGEGKNVYKCTNHDVAFIQDAATKIDTKEKCTIAMLNERQFKTVMASVFAHCLGEAYKVKPPKFKESKATAEAPAA